MAMRQPRELTPRKVPRQARSEATVSAIFGATIQVLQLHGVRRLTTTRVAERARVSVGTLYQYFPNKEALLHATLERHLGQVADAVEESCNENIGQSVAIASDSLVSAYILAKSRDIEASRALYSISSELEVADVVDAMFKRLLRAGGRLLKSCPNVQFDNMDQLIFALMATLTGATRVALQNQAHCDKLDDFHARMMVMCRAFLQSAATER